MSKTQKKDETKEMELAHVKEEMDGWIKHLREEVKLVGDQSDDVEHELMKNGEETKYNYEQINSLNERMDRIEQALENLSSSTTNQNQTISNTNSYMRPLSSR